MSNPGAQILVVDDVFENRDLLIRRLQRLGFSAIDQAENGLQALAAIAAKSYDLVLLDIMMPELDGFGVLESLSRQGLRDLPVIVVSALSEIEPVVRCIELGADDFMLKPINPVLLRARVLATLEKKAMRDSIKEDLRRKQLELNEARTLQLALVPERFSGRISGRVVTVDSLLEPAKEVGGDLVDHFTIGPGMIVLVLGDVSDKGAGAALMMARTHAMVRGLAGRPDAADLFSAPERAAGLVNAELSLGNTGCMFVTFFLATLHVATGHLRYVRAGHIPPYHRTAAAKIERLDHLSGPPLGLDGSVQYSSDDVTMAAGDRLLAVTDGFTEARDAGGAFYGDQRIADFIATVKRSESDPLNRMLHDVRQFEAGGPPFDDTAAILLSLEPSIMSTLELQTFAAPEQIGDVLTPVMAFLNEQQVDERAIHHAALVIEETIVNLGTHGHCTDKPALVRLIVMADHVAGEIIDSGPPFDPTQAPEPDLAAPLEERTIGGVGLYMIRKLCRTFDYSRQHDQNLTRFTVARS